MWRMWCPLNCSVSRNLTTLPRTASTAANASIGLCAIQKLIVSVGIYSSIIINGRRRSSNCRIKFIQQMPDNALKLFVRDSMDLTSLRADGYKQIVGVFLKSQFELHNLFGIDDPAEDLRITIRL